MLSILGMGHSHPENVIDNSFLEGLGIGLMSASILSDLGIEERRTVLPLDYIRKTQNRDSLEGLKAAIQTPTELGAEAATIAIKRSGVDPDAIGLVVAECATPAELTPSEAQRICWKLGIKATAYDVASPGGSVPLFLEVFNSWRGEVVPDYVLCVSTSTITQRVKYSDPSQSSIWGDGAVAMVLSTKHKGKLGLKHGAFVSDLGWVGEDGVESFKHLFASPRIASMREKELKQTVEGLVSSSGVDVKNIKFISPQVTFNMAAKLASSLGVPDQNHWHNVKAFGNTAGAGSASTLAMNWEDLKKGDTVVMTQASLGPGFGAAILSVERS